MRAALVKWIISHPRVVNSPITRDTLLVKNPETKQKERVGKLLLEIDVRELHNDLIELPVEKGGKGGGLAEARDSNGKIIISDTSLRYLLPPQLKRMTEKHKQMCGCEVCLIGDSHQKTLNAFRVRHKRDLRAAADTPWRAFDAHVYQPSLDDDPPRPWHAKVSDALECVQCSPIIQCGLPHWSCVLRRCGKCPKYPVPPEEQGTDENAPTIKFHIYKIATECTKHGILTKGVKTCEQCTADPPSPSASARKRPKVRSRKHLTLMECAIGTFHTEYYLPSLEKLAYHRPHVKILGKGYCGAARLAAFKRKPSVRTRRDYAERLAASFNLEAQAEHFGNGRSLSMEGSSVETFCDKAVEAYRAGVWQMNEADLKMVFHSHFSDESRQDAATTHAHMCVLFDHLKEIGELCAGFYVWDDTDGCGKLYRYITYVCHPPPPCTPPTKLPIIQNTLESNQECCLAHIGSTGPPCCFPPPHLPYNPPPPK